MLVITDHEFDPTQLVGNVLDSHDLRVRSFHPRVPPPDVPKHAPEHATKAFRQGALLRAQKDMEEPAAGMFRRALDVALKVASPDLDKDDPTLYQRIKQLAADGRLTPAIAEWSHAIRLDGNEIHADAPIDRAALDQMHDFTFYVLTYLFTMPKEVEIARARREEGKPPPA